jgi:hypothetical protein
MLFFGRRPAPFVRVPQWCNVTHTKRRTTTSRVTLALSHSTWQRGHSTPVFGSTPLAMPYCMGHVMPANPAVTEAIPSDLQPTCNDLSATSRAMQITWKMTLLYCDDCSQSSNDCTYVYDKLHVIKCWWKHHVTLSGSCCCCVWIRPRLFSLTTLYQ